MKGIVRPSEVSNLVPITLPTYPHEDSESIYYTYGIVSKNNLWMCLVHNTCINIFSTETGRWCGKYCFAESLNNPSAKVTNIVEFISSHISYQCLLVSINQDDESQICMFNVDTGKVVQSVLIPEKVSSLDVVSGDGGVCMETHYLNRRLRYMFGIVAVGTVNGHIYFLDLCLDENFSCDETLPNITIVLRQHEYSANKREAAISKKQHIFLRLNDESDRSGKFELQSRSSTLGRYASSDVTVTAIKYFKSLSTIAVGFEFGGIQLWELHHLTLQFTISTDPHNQPVVNFAFQEPENDPRHFCYLWVFRGHSAVEDKAPETVSSATMYSMTYCKREFVKAFGALYTDLQICNKRFEFPFTNDVYHNSLINPSMNSRLLSCQVISQKDFTHSHENIPGGNESLEVAEEMSLCFITWEIWNHAGNFPSSYHFAVFDLNQWYQAQMPCSFRCDPSSLSPYFGIFSLEETKRVLGKKEILGVFTIPQSIKKFKSLQVSEEFFYPSSLGFQTLSFSHNGLCTTTYFGFQKSLLFEMADLGPRVLISPKDVFSSLVKCGLVSDAHGGIEKTPLVSQREAILQLALEYHLPFFFIKCLKEWRYSDSVHEYCTSRALLNWAWKKVLVIKNSIDRLSVTLFNCSGVDMDKRALKSLYAYRRQLNLIDNIISGYQRHVTPRTEQGIQDLQCRREALSCINLYLQVLLWLRSVHVLPEVCEDEAISSNVVYHFDEINKSYLCRRSTFQALNSSIGATDVLLIDGIVKELGIGGSWQEKNGSGMYPPPSIYAALSTYLLDGVNTNWKHALIFYLLLDIRSSVENTQFQAEVKKFPVIFDMPKSMVKLVKAFWYLDRKDCENAVRKILDPAVKSSDILMWQHHRIIKSCLYYRNPEKALKYINHVTPPQKTVEDMRLYLSVLLACGAITQAFEYQRTKQAQGYGNDLIKHLFLGCQETGKIRELMYLPLSSLESSILIQFLSESENPKAQETLVIYHLLHCNFFEAEKINEKLSLSLMKKRHNSSETLIRERSVDRNNLVECLLSGVSKTEKNLVDEINRLPLENSFKEDYLSEPLSVSVRSKNIKTVSHSDFLRSLMAKTSLSKYPQTPRTPRSGSCLQNLPFLRPINTPESIKNTPDVKNASMIVSKRSFMSTSPNEYATPAKRSRLLDNATFMDTPSSKRKAPRHLAGDIASLLQTPPIYRRISLAKSNPATPAVKPQSILKKSTAAIMETDAEFHRAETPPILALDESLEEEKMHVDEKGSELLDVESEGQSKQIRFDLPLVDQSVVSENVSIHSEITAADDIFETTLGSTPEKSEVSWKKSLTSLTREPLSQILKHSPPISTSDIDAKDNVESATVQSEPKDLGLSKYSKTENSQLETTSGSVHRDQALTSSNTLYSDSGIESTVNFMREGDSFSLSSTRDSSKQTVIQNFSTPGSLRTSISVRPPLRKETPLFETQKPTSSQSIMWKQKNDSPNLGEKLAFASDISPKQSGLEEDDTIIAQDSDEEMFYSPCSSISSPPGSVLNRVKSLNDSDILDNKLQQIDTKAHIGDWSDSVESKNDLVEKRTEKSRKTFIFSRSQNTTSSDKSGIFYPDVTKTDLKKVADLGELRETDNIPMENRSSACKALTGNSSSIENQMSFSSTENTKPSRKTFIFTRSRSQASAKITDTTTSITSEGMETESTTAPSNEQSSKITVDSFSKNKPSENALSEDNVVEESSSVSKDGADNLNIQQSRQTFIFSKPESVITDEFVPDHQDINLSKQNPSKTYIFAQPKSLTEELVSDDQDIASDKQNPSKTYVFAKPDSFFTGSSFSNQSFQIEKPKTSRKTFVFTRSQTSASSETSITSTKTSAEKAAAQTSDPKSFDSFLQPEPLSKPSRKTFVFTRSSTRTTTSMTDSASSIAFKDSYTVESNEKNKTSNKTFVATGKTDKLSLTNQPDEKRTEDVQSDKQTKEEMDMEIEASSPIVNEGVNFLQESAAETYEEFSSTLAKNTPYKNSKGKDKTKTLLSSPCASVEKDSNTLQTGELTDGKKKSLPTKSKVTGSVTKSKKKGKSKISKKIEFSFAEPHSPATPDVLEALSQTPETKPLPSFMFSPPLTRGRLRQKTLDETMGSSFSSVMSETSFSTSIRKPPMDPILEGIMQEKTLQTKRSSKKKVVRSTLKKKTPKAVIPNESLMDVSSQSHVSLNESAASTTNKTLSSARHSMVLRQMRSKKADISFT